MANKNTKHRDRANRYVSIQNDNILDGAKQINGLDELKQYIASLKLIEETAEKLSKGESADSNVEELLDEN